jgi:hypothetical protein
LFLLAYSEDETMTEQAQVLTANRVDEIMLDCVYRDEEVADFVPGEWPEDMVRVDGIVNPYGFHPQRLASHEAEIREMLAELPPDFMRSSGGGMSFLNACVDRHGNHWAEHPTMGALFALGEGVGAVKCILPREMWAALPGGVPYYVVLDDIPETN